MNMIAELPQETPHSPSTPSTRPTISSTSSSPPPIALPQPISSNPKMTLTTMPPEIVRMVVQQLSPADRVSLKYTNSYFHSWVQVRCQTFKDKRRRLHVNRLHRDIGSLQAAVVCPHCMSVRLRSLEHRGPLGSWALKRLTWREQVHACCEARKPRNLPTQQLAICTDDDSNTAGNGSSETVINVQQPGMALFQICLHCSNEVPLWEDNFDLGRQLCPWCQCHTCPTVFMPRRIALSSVDTPTTEHDGTLALVG